MREINLLMGLDHKNIVKIKEVVTGSKKDKIYVVMEYLENELKHLMENMEHPFTVPQIKCLMKQLLEAIEYLHSRFIIHRDLKTSNILFSAKGQLKVCDFGIARVFNSRGRPYSANVVTLWYRSPELILSTGTYTESIDMWSVGCIFAEIILMEALFKGKTELEQLDMIFKCLGVPSEHTWPGFAEILRMKQLTSAYVKPTRSKLAERFSDVNTQARGTVLNHQGFDLLSKMLSYDPKSRITAKEALMHSWFREAPLPCLPEDMPKFTALNTVERPIKQPVIKNPANPNIN